MNWNLVEGNWKQFEGKIKARWGKITDAHLELIAGKRLELSGRLQEAYGISQEEAEKQILGFEESHQNYKPKTEK